MRRLGLLVVTSAAIACGGRPMPGVVTPERARPVKPSGRDRGDVEISLGAVTAGVAATLVGVGILNAVRSAQLREYCSQEPLLTTIDMPDPVYDSLCNDLVGADPARAAAISSGLSFGFAVPIAVASGFLLRKGIRMRREYKRVHPPGAPGVGGARGPAGVRVQPWLQPGRGAGLAVGFRF